MTDPQLILALDTSTPRCVLALGRVHERGDELLAFDHAPAKGREASAQLADRLRVLMDQAGHTPAELSIVACGTGPGMFTGVRVAIATAKGIALGLGLPAVAVSTLAAVAASSDAAVTDRLALLDARRGEMYAGHYRVAETTLEAAGPDRCAPIGDILESLERPTVAIGPGIDAAREALEAHPLIEIATEIVAPGGRGLWRAVVSEFRRSGVADPASVSATYLRKSYAELGIHKPKRPFVKSPFVD